MKRFYKEVSVQPLPEGDSFGIALDGRLVKTPARSALAVCNQQLADLIAAEWAAQGEAILPDTMPLMQIATTCIDNVSAQRDAMQDQLLKYLHTDLLFYRAPEPPRLVKKQKSLWDPLLGRIESHFGMRPAVTDGLGVIEQEAAYSKAMHSFVTGLSDPLFTVFQIVVPLTGSLILGVLFLEDRLQADAILPIIRAEEDDQIAAYDLSDYGLDPQEQAKLDSVLRDLEACAIYRDAHI